MVPGPEFPSTDPVEPMSTLHREQPLRGRSTRAASAILRWGLLLATVAAASGTVFFPDLLRGNAAMNGSARGTALVLLVGAVPLLALGLARLGPGGPASGRREALVPVLVAGATAYCLYNGVMLCFATPFNRLFPAYVAMLGFALWSAFDLVRTAVPLRAPRAPVRAVSGWILVVVVLNTLAWLRGIVPGVVGEDPGEVLRGTGLTTIPTWVQDLALWLPAMSVAAVLLLRAHRWGVLAAGTGLVFWQLSAVGVATDQTFAHVADPTSPVASAGGAWLFAVLFVVGFVPTLALLRRAEVAR